MTIPWSESRFVRPYISQLSPELVDLLNHVLHTDPELVRSCVLVLSSQYHSPRLWWICWRLLSAARNVALHSDCHVAPISNLIYYTQSWPAHLRVLQRADLEAINSHPWMKT